MGEEHIAHGAPKLSYTIAKLRRGPKVGALVDGSYDEDFAARLLTHLRASSRLASVDGGEIVFESGAALEALTEAGEPHPLGVDQSNVSIAFGDSIVLKIYRRLRGGVQPDVEVARFLTEKAGFRNTPAFLGSIEHRPAEGDASTLAVAFAFVRNQGDAWSAVSEALLRDMQENAVRSAESEAVDGPAPFLFPLALGRCSASAPPKCMPLSPRRRTIPHSGASRSAPTTSRAG